MCVTTDLDYILTLTSCNNMFLQIKIFQLEQNRAILCLRAANASSNEGNQSRHFSNLSLSK